MTELLIAEGALVDIAATYVITPLMLAAQNGHAEVVKLLLEHGAYVDASDIGSVRPLQMAAEAGHVEVVALLLEAGADPDNVHGLLNLTALQCAAAGGHTEVVKLLSQDIEYDSLAMAAMLGNVEKVHEYLDMGAELDTEPDASNQSHWTPLHWAAVCGHTDVVRVLLLRRPNVAATLLHAPRFTPVELAMRHGHKEVVKLLREHMARE